MMQWSVQGSFGVVVFHTAVGLKSLNGLSLVLHWHSQHGDALPWCGSRISKLKKSKSPKNAHKMALKDPFIIGFPARRPLTESAAKGKPHGSTLAKTPDHKATRDQSTHCQMTSHVPSLPLTSHDFGQAPIRRLLFLLSPELFSNPETLSTTMESLCWS